MKIILERLVKFRVRPGLPYSAQICDKKVDQQNFQTTNIFLANNFNSISKYETEETALCDDFLSLH